MSAGFETGGGGVENLILVINSKRLSNVIKRLDITWISCDSLHAWCKHNHVFIAMVSSLIARRWIRPQTQ